MFAVISTAAIIIYSSFSFTKLAKFFTRVAFLFRM